MMFSTTNLSVGLMTETMAQNSFEKLMVTSMVIKFPTLC
jgi:hypothetical protein